MLEQVGGRTAGCVTSVDDPEISLSYQQYHQQKLLTVSRYIELWNNSATQIEGKQLYLLRWNTRPSLWVYVRLLTNKFSREK